MVDRWRCWPIYDQHISHISLLLVALVLEKRIGLVTVVTVGRPAWCEWHCCLGRETCTRPHQQVSVVHFF